MTRPKSARRHGWESIEEIRLSRNSRREILEALGESAVPHDDVINEVEVILMIACATRRRPRAANRRELIDELIVATERLEQALLDLDNVSWDALSREIDREKVDLPSAAFRRMVDGAQRLGNVGALRRLLAESGITVPATLPDALTEIARAARQQRSRLATVEGRGKARETNRDNAIRYLAEVFQRSSRTRRDYRGRLIDFVSAALKAACLPVPVSEEKVWTLVPAGLRSPSHPDRPIELCEDGSPMAAPAGRRHSGS